MTRCIDYPYSLLEGFATCGVKYICPIAQDFVLPYKTNESLHKTYLPDNKNNSTSTISWSDRYISVTGRGTIFA
jgi:hypothetical protein